MKALLGEEGYEKHQQQLARLNEEKLIAKHAEDKYRREAERKDFSLTKNSYTNAVK